MEPERELDVWALACIAVRQGGASFQSASQHNFESPKSVNYDGVACIFTEGKNN